MLGYVAGGGYFVGAGRVRAEVALVVPHQFLGGEPAHALHKTAFNLPDVDGRIDRSAHVVQDIHFQDAALAGQSVDGYLGTGCAIGKVVKRPARQGGRVVVDFRGAVKAVAPELDAIGISQRNHGVETACGHGRDDMPAGELDCTSADTVQTTDKCRQ